MSNPLPPAYTTPPPVAGKPRNANSNCLIASLVGCGVLVVVAIIVSATFGIAFSKNPRMRQTFSNLSNSVTVSRSAAGALLEIRAALDGYRKDHGGAYPKTLADLSPDYMVSTSELHVTDNSGQPVPILYTPPSSSAPADTVIVKIHTFDMSFVANQNQQVYIALLKDGSIIQLQEGRMLMYRPGSNQQVTPTFN